MTDPVQSTTSRVKWIYALAAIALVSAGILGLAGSDFVFEGNGGTGPSTSDGVYTLAQADRGRTLYAEQCTLCHPPSLEKNGATPALVGEAFLNKWHGRSAGELFELTMTTMPVNSPGFLTAEQTADLLALMFHANGFPAGDSDLSADLEALNKITILRH